MRLWMAFYRYITFSTLTLTLVHYSIFNMTPCIEKCPWERWIAPSRRNYASVSTSRVIPRSSTIGMGTIRIILWGVIRIPSCEFVSMFVLFWVLEVFVVIRIVFLLVSYLIMLTKHWSFHIYLLLHKYLMLIS